MTRIRTFIDSALLIAAARGTDDVAEKAMGVLDDPDRDFTTSDFVRLEILPKPTYFGYAEEVAFYEAFFERVQQSVPSSATLVSEAHQEAVEAGLAAVDALHVAAAKRADSEELVTAEKSTKPLFRVIGLAVKTIRPSR